MSEPTSRRNALAKLGLLAVAVYTAPVLFDLTASTAAAKSKRSRSRSRKRPMKKKRSRAMKMKKKAQ